MAYFSQGNLGRTRKTKMSSSSPTWQRSRSGQVEPELKEILADYPQFKLVSGQGYLEENKRIFDVAFSAMYVLLAVLATPSLIALVNTLAIGVIERTREIGTLRAIGATQKQVRRMVVNRCWQPAQR
jgi:putative ABC transport system permease protein